MASAEGIKIKLISSVKNNTCIIITWPIKFHDLKIKHTILLDKYKLLITRSYDVLINFGAPLKFKHLQFS